MLEGGDSKIAAGQGCNVRISTWTNVETPPHDALLVLRFQSMKELYVSP